MVLFTSCSGFKMVVDGNRVLMDKKGVLSMSVIKGRSGKNNMVRSMDITLVYKIYKNGIAYNFDPDNFIVDVIYPDKNKQVLPITSEKTGIFRSIRTAPFTLQGKMDIEVRFKIERDEAFNQDSLNVKLISPRFVTQNGEQVFPDTITITSEKWAHR